MVQPRLPPTIRQLLSPNFSHSLPSSNNQIEVNGWIKYLRKQKKVSFAVINDGSCAKGLQAVFLDSESVRGLTNGTSVKLKGTLVPSVGPGQATELQVSSAEVYGHCDPETYPIQKQSLSTEYIRNNAHFQGRLSTPAAMLRIRDRLRKSIHKYFEGLEFHNVHVPILTSNDCEGAGEAFKVYAPPSSSSSSTPTEPDPNLPETSGNHQPHFFNTPSYLTVSTQLHLEALSISSSLNRVYTLSPCFRAERSQTNRHLSEFWMLEAEWGFVTRLEGIMDVLEDCVRHVVGDVVNGDWKDGENVDVAQDLDVLWKGKDAARGELLYDSVTGSKEWTRMSYTDAIKVLLSENGSSNHYMSSTSESITPTPNPRFQHLPAWGEPLRSEHEKYLSEVHIRGPVFITDYPREIKPFYMRLNDPPDDKDNRPLGEERATVSCFDLLIPHVGELAGGSLREERIDQLKLQMTKKGLKLPISVKGDADENAEDDNVQENEWINWYMASRQYGGVPHGGFGLGFERLVGWVCGIDNVRECIAMPRWAGRMIL